MLGQARSVTSAGSVTSRAGSLMLRYGCYHKIIFFFSFDVYRTVLGSVGSPQCQSEPSVVIPILPLGHSSSPLLSHCASVGAADGGGPGV